MTIKVRIFLKSWKLLNFSKEHYVFNLFYGKKEFYLIKAKSKRIAEKIICYEEILKLYYMA